MKDDEPVQRNYTVTGLKAGVTDGRWHVIADVEWIDGEGDPITLQTDLGPVGEFVDLAGLEDEGVWDYFTRAEKTILQRGFTRAGAERRVPMPEVLR